MYSYKFQMQVFAYTYISLVIVALFQPVVVSGKQVALRARSKAQLSARTIPSHATLFDPTDEETFYVSGGQIAWVLLRTLEEHFT